MFTTRLTRFSLVGSLVALSLAACGLPLDGADGSSSLSQELAASSVPSLGAASGFAVLGSSTVTCTNASALTGDVGVSPGTAITGFNPDCTINGSLEAGSAPAA